MSLRLSYTLLAPFYDLVVEPALRAARRASLAALPADGHGLVLVNGVGTGLDVPLLPRDHRYVGLDLTRAMLARSVRRAGKHEFSVVQGDSLALPFRDASFDHAVMHLILAVVPDPARALMETARVVRPGGAILVLDKFLRRGQRAPLRRLLNPVAARLATRLDVVFEDLLPRVPGLRVIGDEAAFAGGWFRRIRLERL
ncbi:MAG: methyltransferase domain-containing protein [Betaproteobacteria bacterium]|nr:methyltransferase domain-containing protein [Betaproteobacteria bacterium]